MKAAWSMGLNSPDDLRSLATTSEISCAASGSSEPSLAKSVMAIGSGWIVPWVMLSSTTARALKGATTRATRASSGRPPKVGVDGRGFRNGVTRAGMVIGGWASNVRIEAV